MFYRTILIILLSVLLIGCKTKKTTTTVTSFDTIKEVSIIKIERPQLSTLTIDEVCDSLGNLKVMNYQINLGKGNASLISKDNSLQLQVNIDSIVQSEVEKYKASQQTEHITIVKETKYIPKWVWYFLALNVLLLVWVFRKSLIKLFI